LNRKRKRRKRKRMREREMKRRQMQRQRWRRGRRRMGRPTLRPRAEDLDLANVDGPRSSRTLMHPPLRKQLSY
jgi:hypothetical protein